MTIFIKFQYIAKRHYIDIDQEKKIKEIFIYCLIKTDLYVTRSAAYLYHKNHSILQPQ